MSESVKAHMNISQSIPPSAQPRRRLSEARQSRNMSQQALADRIGTTQLNVSRWERGVTKPGPYFRRRLCGLFNKSEEELDLVRGIEPGEAASQSAEDVDEGNENVRKGGSRIGAYSAVAAVPGAIYDSAIPENRPLRLIGRDQELAELRKRLFTSGNVALTALNGLPGVGKTALAIALAHDPEMREHFRDGILWAGLGPQPNREAILGHWGRLLDLPPNELEGLKDYGAWAKALRHAIGSRSFLLILDDVWNIEDAQLFRVGGARCAHLMTMREPKLAARLTADGVIRLEELAHQDGLDLLHMLAPQVVELEQNKAYQLVQAVGGLPLALTLIGNYLRHEVPNARARRIQAVLERLSDAEVRLQISEHHGYADAHTSLEQGEHLSLRSIFAVTDQRLPKHVQQALYALSVFPPKPNTFAEDAAVAIAACDYDTIDELSDTGLLESVGNDRYTLHQTIADYAQWRLKESGLQYVHEACERLLLYVLRFIDEYRKDYVQLDLGITTILHALNKAHEFGWHEYLVKGVLGIVPYMLPRYSFEKTEGYLKLALAAAQVLGNTSDLTTILLYLGKAAQKRGNYAEAEDYLQEGLQLAESNNDNEQRSAVLMELGTVTAKNGKFAKAEIYLQEALELARGIGNPGPISAILTELGTIEWRNGKYVQANNYLRESLELAPQLEDHKRISILGTLGSIASRLGNYNQAEIYLQEGLELAERLRDREQKCLMLMNLGVIAGEQGNHVAAESYFKEALPLAYEIGHRERVCGLLANLGGSLYEQGKYSQAEKYLQEGLGSAREIGQPEWICVLLINLGSAVRKQEDFLQAEKFLREGLAVAKEIGIPSITANALLEYGELYLQLSQVEKAESIFQEMLNVVPEEIQDLKALGKYGLARTQAARGNLIEAKCLGQISVKVLNSIGHQKAKDVDNWLRTI